MTSPSATATAMNIDDPPSYEQALVMVRAADRNSISDPASGNEQVIHSTPLFDVSDVCP